MAERPSNLYGYVWRTPDTGSHRFSTLGRVSIPVSLSTRCRTIGGTCRSPDYSNKMTETDVEAADGSVSYLCTVGWLARDCLTWAGKDPSGSSSDDGGFLAGAEGEGAGDSGHTLPVRNSRSVQSTTFIRTPVAPTPQPTPYYFDFPHFSITLLHDLWFAHDQLVMVFCWWIALLSHLCCCDFNKTIRFATWRGCDKNPIQSVDVV